MTLTVSSQIALDPFNRLAEHYATEMDHNPFAKYIERPTIMEMIGEVEGKKILDLGCGSGWHTLHLLNQGADVVSIDLSPEMVIRAKMRIGERGNIHVANIEKGLPFIPDGGMDLVCASLVLHFMDDWHEALSEIHRILAPGGEMVFSICHPTFADYIRTENQRYNKTEIVEEKIGGVFTYRYRKTFSTIMNSLSKAGFTLVEMREPEPDAEMAFVPNQGATYQYLVENPYFLFMKVKKLD